MKKILTYTIENRILKKITLSKCVDTEIIRTTGRLVEMKGKLHLALESFYANGKTKQTNILAESAADMIAQLVPAQYKQMNISTDNGNCEIKVSKKDTTRGG